MPHVRVSKTGELLPTRILVVEDCSATREIISDSLALHGYRVDTAADGAEGLARFHSGGYDLVVTDHDMPQLDGRQLAAAIKAATPEIPVLMASADPLGAYDSMPLTVDFFIRKPFTLVQLREAINSIVCLHQPPVPATGSPARDRQIW